MTDQLDKQTLLALMRLKGELGEIGHHNIDESFEHLRGELGRVLNSDHSFLLVHLLDDALPQDPSAEISSAVRTAFIKSMGADAERRTQIGRDWAASTPEVLDDPVVRITSEQIGTPRTLVQIQDIEREEWRGSAVPDLLAELGMRSRVMTFRPVDRRAEVTFGFDRTRADGPFSERDRQLLALAFDHLTPLLRSLCQRRGWLPDQTELPP